MGGEHQVGCYGFCGHGFDSRGFFLLGLPSAGLRAAVDLGPGFFPLNTVAIDRRAISPTITELKRFPQGKGYTGKVEAATRDDRGAYPQLRCVCLKRCRRVHCNEPFGVTYDSTDTRKLQSS